MYIGNLPYTATSSDLRELLEQFGAVKSASIALDTMTSRSKGFGWAEWENTNDADYATSKLNGAPITSTCALASSFDETDEPNLSLLSIVAEIGRRLAQEVANHPETLDQIEWRDLERMLAAIYRALGFTVIETRPGPDGGVDLRLACAEAKYVVQIKHWVSGRKVSGDVLRSTVSIAIQEESDAVVLSTSGFTGTAPCALTELESQRLRLGGRREIVLACRTFEKLTNGIIVPVSGTIALLKHTKAPKDFSAR